MTRVGIGEPGATQHVRKCILEPRLPVKESQIEHRCPFRPADPDLLDLWGKLHPRDVASPPVETTIDLILRPFGTRTNK